ncbi:TMEM175 family protein [Adhaeribacter soli]|uniref:DUF1211 domain-containing protein n=1 Tax=Adhaeribacter soli TaxID=2607655 RepID=A0A5N1J5Z0_9BACT|nr:TMEM175 family protein [Adhaeribacter soli]KAA9340587.1 DUF1211 domain-containing protein [Adhaeribacter soli]
MSENQLIAFSDGVIAIIITIMVLDLHVPDNPNLKSYLNAWPIFAGYALSFLIIGNFWVSHHNIFRNVSQVSNKTLWINLFCLFWLSFIPFTTSAMGKNAMTEVAVTVYAINIMVTSLCYFFLSRHLLALHIKDAETIKTFSKSFRKTYLTITLYICAILISLSGWPVAAFVIMVVSALSWLIPVILSLQMKTILQHSLYFQVVQIKP